MRILDAVEDEDQRILDVLEEGRDVGFVELTNRPMEVCLLYTSPSPRDES
jgi:hypothetical protein